jgi:tripartite-type tricarboxylate transporter receptor subunit TctC
MIRRRSAIFAPTLACAVSGLTPLFSHAQTGQKQILRIVSSGAAGSVSDMLARPLAAAMATSGRAVIVENRPGAGGFLAINELMRSGTDGTTMMLFSAATTSWNRHLYRRLPYDPADIVPVSPLAAIPMVLAVRPSLPV